MFTEDRLRTYGANTDRLSALFEVRYELVLRKTDARYDLVIRTVSLAPPLADG